MKVKVNRIRPNGNGTGKIIGGRFNGGGIAFSSNEIR